ncbi:melanoma-associated antigen B1-like [Dasypus novemcinctus]|uniref:melanoma-associated antigen B1-like n=1 Tax=Dasypus novemcinctus TaxID=9361 RepID=UPI00265EA1FD|nr:melanoma-associated antigen B1-like [Dasypus novemcinctus]
MPRGQKSKLRAREKRRQAHGETPGLQAAQAPAAEEEASTPPSSPPSGGTPQSSPAAGRPPSPTTPPSSPPSGGTPQSSPAAGRPQGPHRSPSPTTPTKAFASLRVDDGARCPEETHPGPSQAAGPMESYRRDPLTRKANMLVDFLTEKFKTNEPISKAAMLKIVNRKYKDQFPEILRRVCERMELVFGLELKEVDPSGQSYSLVSKLDLTTEGSLGGGGDLPKTGLLMTLLAVIFMKGNRATEEEVWEFLNALGVFAGRKHLIFGEPHQLLTIDLVQEKYLEYRQVPRSDPPCYEFLWGSRAHAETTKMKVLEILAKINDTVPSSFPVLYEEALRDEQERAAARIPGRASVTTLVRAQPWASASRHSHK